MAAMILMLSGCELPKELTGWWPRKKPITIAEPPYIPLPPAVAETPREGPMMFADLLDIQALAGRHPELQAAVEAAIRHGILKPKNAFDRFQPDRPVTYSEFRTWVDAFRSVQVAHTLIRLNEEPPAEGAAPPVPEATVEHTVDNAPVAATGTPVSTLPPEMRWGEVRLTAESPVSRQAFLALAAQLDHWQEEAKTLSSAAIEAARPNGSPPEAAFGNFKDYDDVDEWARPYAAYAYQSGLLQAVFRLTAEQLVETTGFQPARTITREEAIVALNRFYPLPAAPPEPAAEPTEPMPAGTADTPATPRPKSAKVVTPE